MQERRSKLVSIHDAIAQIPDGAKVAIGGSLIRRAPMALVREIVRQKKKDLTLYSWSAGMDFDMLIGGGCGVLAALDVQHRYFPDAILDAAHCEYIQLLLNWGVLGLGAYLVWIVLALRRAWKKGGALAFALAAGLLGYGVQALVNIAQAPGISLFFVLLAVLRGQNDAEELTCG